ncbi:MAG: S41 family peptidase [Phycisphaerales bacterium JB040]
MLIACLCLPAPATPPRVVEVTPDNGDVDVDPGLKRITVKFDQPMSREGFSIVGGGETFPEVPMRGRWLSDTTFILPVRLEPGHEYWFSVNNETFNNFRNVHGEPAVPYPVSFWTAEGEDAPRLTPEQNAASVDELLDLLTTRYSHRDRLGLDWSARVETYRERLVAAGTPLAFARLTTRLLAAAKDKHVWVESGEHRMGTHVAPVTPNANPALLRELVGGYRRHNEAVATGTLAGGVAYLAIDTWGLTNPALLEPAFEHIGRARNTPGLVIDVRMNGGGDESLAQQVAGCFIEQPVLYATHVFVTEDGGFTEPGQRWLAPSDARPRYSGPVAVLTGPVVMSSNEAFLLMMRQAEHARLFGAPSQGSSGNPRGYELPNGVSVYLPAWISMTPEGDRFEGVGLEPDVPVEATPDDFAGRDPVLEAALAWIAERD